MSELAARHMSMKGILPDSEINSFIARRSQEFAKAWSASRSSRGIESSYNGYSGTPMSVGSGDAPIPLGCAVGLMALPTPGHRLSPLRGTGAPMTTCSGSDVSIPLGCAIGLMALPTPVHRFVPTQRHDSHATCNANDASGDLEIGTRTQLSAFLAITQPLYSCGSFA